MRHEHGPFDIVGDIHGCYDELRLLLTQLGYTIDERDGDIHAQPPDGRKLISLGDLTDRGPKSPEVLRLIMNMVDAGTAFCVPGNHDDKLMRYLNGRNVRMAHGLELTARQLADEPPEFRARVRAFLASLATHHIFDDGKLVVAHAGLKRSLQGHDSGAVRSFALYGATTGKKDEFGLPVRLNWAAHYRALPFVVYGHTPVPEPLWQNRTVNIDTGCVFGGALTALRYPEVETVSVPALEAYAVSARPFGKD